MSSSSQNPVVLVHGIDDTATKLFTMQSFLNQQGWTASALSLSPSNGDAGLDLLAEQLAQYIDATYGQRPVDVVGFSMGGIVSRYYMQRLGGINRVQRFITIASPHNGTWLAYLRYNQGAAQMRRQSAFLHQLNQDVHQLSQIQFTSIWTPLDLMIVPAHSSRLPVGDEVQIPVLVHSWMVSDRRCLEAIAQILRRPITMPKATEHDPDQQACCNSSSSGSG